MIAVGYLRQQQSPSLQPMGSESDQQIQKTLTNNIKLKNELCRNYLETGYCKYHDKCQFAHGVEQLRQHHNVNMKYKTKKCLSYFDKAQCSYGERCNFQHMQNLEIQDQAWKKAKNNFRQIFWFARNRVLPFDLPA